MCCFWHCSSSRKRTSSAWVWSGCRFDRELFTRLLRYGVPGSLQFTMDILAFTLFILLVGRISTLALAATNIVMSINALAFMPSMGVSQGTSVLVGRPWGGVSRVLPGSMSAPLALCCSSIF